MTGAFAAIHVGRRADDRNMTRATATATATADPTRDQGLGTDRKQPRHLSSRRL
jgi:hypothetical protein